MPIDTEVPRTDEAEDQEGGPVKSFLDHLEDLRWVLIKSLASLGIAMLLCLIGGNFLVKGLTAPLRNAKFTYAGTNQVWTIYMGTNILKIHTLTDEQQAAHAIPWEDRHVALKLELLPDAAVTNRFLVSLELDSSRNAQKEDPKHIRLINLKPIGGFIVAIKAAIYGGLVLASPFIFYFIAGFVFPALRIAEKRYVYRGLGFGVSLFFLGVAFCYFVLLPVVLATAVKYSNWLGFEANQWEAESYISFVCRVMIGMGIGFQMPVVLLTLVKIGVLTYRSLSRLRMYMVVINLVLAAVLTPPEIMTQVMMAVPLQLLYELSVIIAWYWDRRDRKRAEAEERREKEEHDRMVERQRQREEDEDGDHDDGGR